MSKPSGTVCLDTPVMKYKPGVSGPAALSLRSQESRSIVVNTKGCEYYALLFPSRRFPREG